ncbi:cmp dcmp deaminase family [Lentinula edodes]|uniref:Cmp dcmp deaminase family n=1 Tax=Lentinula edodes TaxID=5353 RepID=A0A1Q3EDG8_LENED|nr:cmp dcmp deaminase family [Lentinula edodes]
MQTKRSSFSTPISKCKITSLLLAQWPHSVAWATECFCCFRVSLVFGTTTASKIKTFKKSSEEADCFRKGDTGSVVWKASVDLAFSILQHERFPSTLHPFLDLTQLKNAHLLELGSGTGILCVALSPFVRNYTCTDLPDLLPLIHKNLIGWNCKILLRATVREFSILILSI